MSKIYHCLEFCGDTFMLCELFTVIECNGVASILVGSQQACCHSCHAVGMFTTNMPGQYIARLSLGECDQSTTMILADDGITFPITNTRLLINYFWTIINTDAVFNNATSFLPTGITLAAWFLATQVTAQVAAIKLVGIDMLVDCFMADLQSAFQLKTVGSLLWAQVFSYQTINLGPFAQGEVLAVITGLLTFIAQRLRLVWPPTTFTLVAPELS